MLVMLRKLTMDDVEPIARYANNEGIARHLRDGFPHPYTREAARAYVEAAREADDRDKRFRAVCVDGAFAGCVGVFRLDDVYRRGAEIGYWLAEPYWGRGVMTQAVRQICAETFAETSIVRIEAGVYATNPASGRVLEKCGFALEGVHRNSVYKNGRILDAMKYALLKPGTE